MSVLRSATHSTTVHHHHFNTDDGYDPACMSPDQHRLEPLGGFTLQHLYSIRAPLCLPVAGCIISQCLTRLTRLTSAARVPEALGIPCRVPERLPQCLQSRFPHSGQDVTRSLPDRGAGLSFVASFRTSFRACNLRKNTFETQPSHGNVKRPRLHQGEIAESACASSSSEPTAACCSSTLAMCLPEPGQPAVQQLV